jgi:hypothetical protein
MEKRDVRTIAFYYLVKEIRHIPGMVTVGEGMLLIIVLLEVNVQFLETKIGRKNDSPATKCKRVAETNKTNSANYLRTGKKVYFKTSSID